MSHFITAKDLAASLGTGTGLVLLDLRYDPGKGSARSRFEDGHLPTARFVELESVFAGPGNTGSGNAPLPSPELLEAGLRDVGLDNDTDIVVYDDTSGGPSARAWWVLTWAGARRVRVLDGGLTAWTATGRSLAAGDQAPQRKRGSFSVDPGQLRSADVHSVAKIVGGNGTHAILLDTRGAPQFAGDEANPRTGHIPGAHNLPQPAFTSTDGTLADRDHILAALRSVGVEDAGNTDIVLYCGAGISSAYSALALAEHGIPASLYPGSFSEWTADQSRPVEQGQEKKR